MRRAPHLAAAFLLAVAMVAAAGRLRAARDEPYDLGVVPPAGAVRWLSLGHALTASHLYWLRTVQYLGDARADQRGWEKLHPVLELVTDLDPRHGYAYQVGGVILASAGRVAESNALLEKGTRNVPDRYVLPYFRAFNAFYYDGDWPAAGRWAEVAARAPGAPAHVRQNVLAYYVKGQRAEAAVAFLEEAYRSAGDEETRKALAGQLGQARLERAAEPVDEALARWRARYGFGPLALESLVRDGLLDAVPPDPLGGELVPGPDGRVRSTVHDRRIAPRPSAAELYDARIGAPGTKP